MAIDPKLLIIKPVDELTEVTGLQDGDLLFYDGSGNLKRISIAVFNNLSKTAKPLKPTDTTPTVAGLYMPTEIGTYANAGGLIAEDGFDTLFYFNGTTWTKRALPYPKVSNNLPQFANLSFPVTNTATEKVQCVDNFVPYQLIDGKTSTSANTPSTSPTIWKAMGEVNIFNNTYTTNPSQLVPTELLYDDIDNTPALTTYKRISEEEGVDVNYLQTSTWYDGSIINDSKLDGYIYKKIDGKYVVRQIDKNVNLKVGMIEDLRNFNGYYEGQEITLLGYYNSGDKPPLVYKFTISNFSTNIDDGGSLIKSSRGSWIAQFDNSIDVRHFGAGYNGANDSFAIQKAINFQEGEIFIPSRVYNLKNKLIWKSNVRLRGIGAGAYFAGEGYVRLSTLKPTADFEDDVLIDVDPLNISPGLAYMFGISFNDFLIDAYNIRNEEKILINLLSLSNSETSSNIRIINNNKNIAIKIDRSTNPISYEPDGLVFHNIYCLQATADNTGVVTPVLRIGSANEISFFDSKFQRGALVSETGTMTVHIKSNHSDRASNAISFYSCSFTGSSKGLIAESRDADGQGVRNLRVLNGTFENVKDGITLKGTASRPNQFAMIQGNRFLSTASGGSNILLDDYASNNQIIADEITSIRTTVNASANMIIGGELTENLGSNNAWMRRNKDAFDFKQYKVDWFQTSLLNGWVSNTSSRQEFGISKKDGKVILRGYLTGGTFGFPNYITQLPIGYRPLNSIELAINTDGGLGTLVILSDGNIFVQGSVASGAISLTGTEFYID